MLSADSSYCSIVDSVCYLYAFAIDYPNLLFVNKVSLFKLLFVVYLFKKNFI